MRLCCRAWTSSSMVVSYVGFLATNLNPLGLVEARRAERSPEECKILRFAGWRVLKMPALARVSMGWETNREVGVGATSEATWGGRGSRDEEEGPVRESGTYKDLFTRSVQITHRLDPDVVMGGEWCRGDIGGGSIWGMLGSRKFEKCREEGGWAREPSVEGKWCSSN